MMQGSVRASLLALACTLVAACSGIQHKDVEPTQVDMAAHEVAETELLDVGIVTFDAGVDAGEAEADTDPEEAVSLDIRQGESRYMPVHLKNTMQRTGHWGAVRVVPSPTEATDVQVTGKILHSDGETLELAIDARDATGRTWFSHVYEATKEADEYGQYHRGDEDPFQDLYNTVANDLARHKASLDGGDIENIRRVSEMRFAAWIAPDVFQSYLSEDEEGVWHLVRLPAEDDPMLLRVNRIREREYMLIDTLTSHYEVFYSSMWDPYVGWRHSNSEEMAALREIEREALTRKILGGALIAGAIALDILGGGGNTASLRNVMLVGGAWSIKSGIDMGGQAEIHEDAIRELGVSFESEVKPMVVEVDGETVELTGSAEAQYADWRRILERIYITETGLGAADVPPAGAQTPRPVDGSTSSGEAPAKPVY